MDTKCSNILKIALSEEKPYLLDWNTSPHITDVQLPQKSLNCGCKNSLPPLSLLPEVPTEPSGGTVYMDLICWTCRFRDGAWALSVLFFMSMNHFSLLTVHGSHLL